jgi:hypothetical protein
MARTATQASPRLIALALPGTPESVPIARRRVRAALGLHGLGEFTEDAEFITSELVANAVQHACEDGTGTIDADYSPQYVKLARVLRDKIESGQYRRGDSLPAADLAGQYKVSVRVTCNALAMLAANRYLNRPGPFSSYNIIWQGGA